MVVGRGDPSRGDFHQQLRFAGARPRTGASRRVLFLCASEPGEAQVNNVTHIANDHFPVTRLTKFAGPCVGERLH